MDKRKIRIGDILEVQGGAGLDSGRVGQVIRKTRKEVILYDLVREEEFAMFQYWLEPITPESNAKALEKWLGELRHAYRWRVDKMVIGRTSHWYHSAAPRYAPTEEELRYLLWLRYELRRLQNGRVHLHRSLFHA